jgi:hypothetical protein
VLKESPSPYPRELTVKIGEIWWKGGVAFAKVERERFLPRRSYGE